MMYNYYGSLEEFIKDLEKENISYKLEDNFIEIDGVMVKYEEKSLPIRSFSTPRFPKKGLVLISLEELSKVNDICLRYNEDEVNSIIRDMPVIDDYCSKHMNSLTDVAIIWRDHFLEENVGLLNGFVKMGVNPKNILALDKGDSTLHRFEITETFKKMGFQVDILDNTALNDEVLIEAGKKIIFDFINQRKDLKVIVLDDGAIVTKIIDQKYFDNVLGVVELTEMGLRRIRPNESELLYPVLNVAKTKLKRHITYTEISNTIFTRILELLKAEKIVGRKVVMCGYGDLGEILADRLRSYGVRVAITDPDVLRLIIASERGFNTYKTCLDAVKNEKPFMIIGASGYNSISKEVIELLPNYAFVTAGATADLYQFKKYEEDKERFQKILKYGTQYYINDKYIDVLGNGRSVNLFDSEAIPNKSNDVFKASQLVTVYNIVHDKELDKKIETDIVDKWIEESGILDKYYSLYMEA